MLKEVKNRAKDIKGRLKGCNLVKVPNDGVARTLIPLIIDDIDASTKRVLTNKNSLYIGYTGIGKTLPLHLEIHRLMLKAIEPIIVITYNDIQGYKQEFSRSTIVDLDMYELSKLSNVLGEKELSIFGVGSIKGDITKKQYDYFKIVELLKLIRDNYKGQALRLYLDTDCICMSEYGVEYLNILTELMQSETIVVSIVAKEDKDIAALCRVCNFEYVRVFGGVAPNIATNKALINMLVRVRGATPLEIQIILDRVISRLDSDITDGVYWNKLPDCILDDVSIIYVV